MGNCWAHPHGRVGFGSGGAEGDICRSGAASADPTGLGGEGSGSAAGVPLQCCLQLAAMARPSYPLIHQS